MKFQQLLDPNSPVFNVPGFPDALYPDDVPSDMRAQIESEFYSYDLALSPPWVWVERFHHVINRHLYQWEKLLASEHALRDDDAIFNYDLTETTASIGSSSSTTTSSGSTDDFISDTPDGSLTDISNYMSSGSRSSGTSTATTGGSTNHNGNMRRYGNIGVMTSAQIMNGYRDAMDFDAYRIIFRELEPLFIGSFDLDSMGEFDLLVRPNA